MLRTRWLAGGLLALALAAPAPAATQESALAQVPAEAPVIIQVHGVERTRDRLATMLKHALPDAAPALQAKLDEAYQKGLEGRQLKGLVKDGPIFIVLTEMPKQGGKPGMAALIRVSDYKAFRDGILTEDERKTLKTEGGLDAVTINGEEYFLVNRKDYAVVTPQKEVAEQFAKGVKGSEGRLNKALAQKLLDADVGLFVDMAAINKEYGPQIQFGQQLAQMALQQQAGAQANQEMTKKFIEGLFQAIQDSRALLLTFEFRPEGFALHLQGHVGPETKTNLVLKDVKVDALADLDRMPAGAVAYSAIRVDEALLKEVAALFFGVQAGDESATKALQDALKEVAASKPSLRLDAFRFPAQGLQVWKCQEPGKAADAVLKLVQSLKGGGSFMSGALKEKPEVQANAQKHRSFTLHHVRLKWDTDKMIEDSLRGNPLGEDAKKKMAEAMRKMMGEEIQDWFGSDGKVFVQVIAPSWDAARKQLDEYLDGKNAIGQQPAYRAARQQLPAEATMVALMDVPRYVPAIMGVVQAFVPAGQIPELSVAPGKEAAYVGVAVTLQAERGSFDLWFPGSTANMLFKMFHEAMMKKQQGG